jgi:threonine dehydrogenase-like Zn-dependent dehydrogenase
MISEGRLAPASVVTHRLPLAEAAEAYRMFDNREATKIVLTP